MLGFDWKVGNTFENVVLPLGISFYTFQALSYTIDVYRSKVKPTKNFFDFMLFVSLFPQLIAGPIVRYIDIQRQLINRENKLDDIYIGIIRFIMGLAKKVVLANSVAVIADQVFNMNLNQIDTKLAWIGIICYSLQIYLDFSAYSDMAIGLARVFGFRLMENFNLPYTAISIQDFWRRWHISLSTWLRDYLYIPLGGNRKGQIRTYINLMVVFILCGLWHGANWTFILWGLWHGIFLIAERMRLGKIISRWPKSIRHVYVLLQVCIGWVIFRADNVYYAARYIKRMLIPTKQYGAIEIIPAEFLQNDILFAIILGILSSIGTFVALKSWCLKKGKVHQISLNVGLVVVFLFVILKLYSGGYNPFIYFRF